MTSVAAQPDLTCIVLKKKRKKKGMQVNLHASANKHISITFGTTLSAASLVNESCVHKHKSK